MVSSLLSFILSIIIPLGILMVSLILSMRSFSDREKLSPFECGFDPKSNARIPFSMRFFLLAVIFLVFDIEIGLLMPTPILILSNMNYQAIIGLTLFLIILLIGLFHEWREGSLNWKE